MSKTIIPNHLSIVRRKLGLSRKQVAATLGYSLWTVARHEEGKLIPPLASLLKLEILYQMPIAYLYQDFYAELRAMLRQGANSGTTHEHQTPVREEVAHV